MGDHRISVEISVTGLDGNEAKIDWWLNWSPDIPSRLFNELVRKAEGVGLQTCSYYEKYDNVK